MVNIALGVLAFQGGFEKHREKLASIGASTLLVKKQVELDSIDGLVLPGGESTTLLKLLDKDFRIRLVERYEAGLPILTTCAGTILAAKSVTSPIQDSLNLIDITVERNSYGRQVDSRVVSNLHKCPAGEKIIQSCNDNIEGVFIRAPRITAIGKNVESLLEFDGDPVLVKEGNVLSATFHPELSSRVHPVHSLFVEMVKNSKH